MIASNSLGNGDDRDDAMGGQDVPAAGRRSVGLTAMFRLLKSALLGTPTAPAQPKPAPSSPPLLMGERPTQDHRPLAPPVMGPPALRNALIGQALAIHRGKQAIFAELNVGQRARLVALAQKTLMSHRKG